MPDIFISYSHVDRASASRFAAAFESLGFRVWWDQTLRAGEAYDEVTENALRTAKCVVVLWSQKSVASRWVRAEATVAERNRTLTPVMIEACERPIMFELTQTADLCAWRGETGDPAFQALLADVRRHCDRGAPEAATAVNAAPPPRDLTGEAPALAILPFANRSLERTDDVFADGMVEDLIAAMSLGRGVRMIASSATRGYRDRTGDLRLIGRELGARYILEGNVRRAGDVLKVTAQLVEAETGAVLWAARFERPLKELADLQEALIADIAAELGVEIQRVEMARVLKKPGDLTAWEAVMRSFSAYGRLGPDTIPVAVAEARRAVEIAPDYGVAHGALALAEAALFLWGGFFDDALKRDAIDHAEKARTLAPDDPNALWLACLSFCAAREFDEALRCGARAVAINPHNSNARSAYAQALLYAGRPNEAIAEMDVADRLAPRGFVYFLSLANRAAAHCQLGDYERALDTADRALTLSPTYAGAMFVRVVALTVLGREAEAKISLDRLTAAHPYLAPPLLDIAARSGAFGAAADTVSAAIARLISQSRP